MILFKLYQANNVNSTVGRNLITTSDDQIYLLVLLPNHHSYNRYSLKIFIWGGFIPTKYDAGAQPTVQLP